MTIVKAEGKKQFSFRGKTLDELRQLDIREFARYLKSRERRSVMRHFDVIERFLKRYKDKDKIRTHNRDLIIVPQMIGLTIYVHNGKEFFPVKVAAEMLGHRLGEFAATRRLVKHGAPGIGATRSSAALSVK
ncbi:MAG: 30S ribosomal protein S19 [Nanoarchaeota archaeon]